MVQKIGMIRHTERFDVVWDDRFSAVPLSEDHRMDIARFYWRTSAPLYLQDGGGCLAEALYDVERYLNYHRGHPRCPIFSEASTLVYDNDSTELVAICLCAGSESEGHIFNIFVHPDYRRRSLATRMLQRALTVFADHNEVVDLEADPEGIGVLVYRKLGFTVIHDNSGV